MNSGRSPNMLTRALAGAAVLAFMLCSQPLATATTTVTTLSVVNGLFSYQIAEDAGGRITTAAVPPSGLTTPFSSAGTDVADYFTIYDFMGFTGIHTEPAGWTFISQIVGPTDDNLIRIDGPTVNLTWYKSSGATVGPITINGFSATSSLMAVNLDGQWSSEDTQNGGTEDGRTTAAIGRTSVPTSVPEPASLVSLGVGLFGLASWRRLRRK